MSKKITCAICKGKYEEYEMAVYTVSAQPLCEYCYRRTMEREKAKEATK